MLHNSPSNEVGQQSAPPNLIKLPGTLLADPLGVIAARLHRYSLDPQMPEAELRSLLEEKMHKEGWNFFRLYLRMTPTILGLMILSGLHSLLVLTKRKLSKGGNTE